MTENASEQEGPQDPAEPMKVDQVVETHTAGEEPSEDASPQQTEVRTTVEQPNTESVNDDEG